MHIGCTAKTTVLPRQAISQRFNHTKIQLLQDHSTRSPLRIGWRSRREMFLLIRKDNWYHIWTASRTPRGFHGLVWTVYFFLVLGRVTRPGRRNSVVLSVRSTLDRKVQGPNNLPTLALQCVAHWRIERLYSIYIVNPGAR